jgi:hypothetical protein
MVFYLSLKGPGKFVKERKNICHRFGFVRPGRKTGGGADDGGGGGGGN